MRHVIIRIGKKSHKVQLNKGQEAADIVERFLVKQGFDADEAYFIATNAEQTNDTKTVSWEEIIG